ncbi:WD40 repeat domain-containing protein [Litoribrevibacter euphylliae]|uniref:WD40 repeat domain-containing protein n=1 Tax=Litoribrevibacter euphylliae TaxID=1834034 RepID=A0ABV7HI61_9GAMM
MPALNKTTTLVKAAHRLCSVVIAALMLSACSGEPPSNFEEYAMQGIRDGNLDQRGARVVIASINHGGSFWNTEDHERLFNWNHQSGGYSDLTLTAVNPKGSIALTADTKAFVAWNTNTGKSLGYWNTPSRLHSLALHPNGKVAALGREDNLATIFDINAGRIVRSLAHGHTIRSVYFIPQTDLLLTGSEDTTANLWNWKTGQKVQSWKHTFPVDVVISNNAKDKVFVAAYMDDGFLYDLKTGGPLTTTGTQRQRISSARFSPDDNYLALGLFDGHVQLHDATTGEMLHKWRMHIRPNVYRESSHVTDLAFTSSGNQLVALGSNGLLNHFNLPQ